MSIEMSEEDRRQIISVSLGLLHDACATWMKHIERDPSIVLRQPAMDQVFKNMRTHIDDAERAWRGTP